MFEILRIQVSRGDVDPKSSKMILHSVQTGEEQWLVGFSLGMKAHSFVWSKK